MVQDFLNYAEQNPEVVAALSATLATLVAFISILLSLYGLFVQRRHNRASVMPIAVIGYWDYNKEIVVRVRNGGVGPLTIQALTVKSKADGFVANTIHDHVIRRGHKYRYSHITGNPKGRVLSPAGKTTLLRLTGDPDDARFAQKRDNVRQVLSSLTVRVTYSDIYGRTVGTAERSLEWFGRHFQDDVDGSGDVQEPLVIESEFTEEDQGAPLKPSSK